MKTGTVTLPLHGGRAPRWLFNRMTGLSREIIYLMVSEYGAGEFLDRISDPLWFQAFGCVLGFDWHSSGITTTVCGALKESIKGQQNDLGLYIAGGKGATSRKTPSEIEAAQEKLGIDFSHLIYSSRISAKVDNNALQDGYQLYHHCFFFTADGKKWAVIQQGMSDNDSTARRYHWLSSRVVDYVCEPHSAICCNRKDTALNLVAEESTDSRKTIAEISCEKPKRVLSDLNKLLEHNQNNFTYPSRHNITISDVGKKRLEKILISTYQRKPADFEKLLSLRGVGPKTIRALAMISELVYGIKYSLKDPVRFSFAHGGKDGIPYPVDRQNYDRSIEILHRAVKESKTGRTEKIKAIKRLSIFYNKNKPENHHE